MIPTPMTAGSTDMTPTDSRALNDSVKFLDVVRTTQHVGSRVDYTPNISVYSWGVNPTDIIPTNVSTIPQRAYDPIGYFHGFVLRSNHERLRLKRIELKRIRVEEYLARIFQDVSDKVASNVLSCMDNVEKFDTIVQSSTTQERNL